MDLIGFSIVGFLMALQQRVSIHVISRLLPYFCADFFQAITHAVSQRIPLASSEP